MVSLIIQLFIYTGDQVNKKGGMTGGYYDYRKSKLKFVKTIKENKTLIKKKEAELKEIEVMLKDILCLVLI